MSNIDPSVFIEAGEPVKSSNGASIIPIPMGESAMALTYTVHVDGKVLFMKRLKPHLLTQDTYRQLFKKEYEVGSELSHHNIVQYELLHNQPDDCYLLMEHIQGDTLSERILSSPQYFTKRAQLDKFVLQLLDGVGYLHEHNVLHGDLKPQNIMLTQVNNDVKIIDLGFCLSNSYITTAGMTPTYAAPEQLEGALSEMSHTTDIYAIGKILEYIDLRTRKGLPAIYRRIMRQCLHRNPANRYSSVAEIQNVLNRRWWKLKRVWGAVALIVISVCCIWCATLNKPQPLYDIDKYGIGYKIISDENNTCEAVCHTKYDEIKGGVKNIILHSMVLINGKEYNVVGIADSSFVGDTLTRSVHIPEGVKYIGEGAFIDLKNVSLIKLPNSVTYIGKEAFMGMDNLKHLYLGNGLDTIYERTFACNYRLLKVEIPEGIKTLKLDAFAGCWDMQSVSLPSTLTTIERGVFYQCTSLTEITIPASVEYIGEYAFYECEKLTKIYNLNPTPQPGRPIVNNPSQITLYVPAGAAQQYRQADFWREMNITELPE